MEKQEQINKFKEEYGESKNGNFFICDTIGVPHPYCIGSRHVAHAADHFSGMLGKPAIESAEKHGIKCGVKGCNLSYAEHETALLICCKKEIKIDENTVNPELHEWLMKIKDKVDSEKKYVGFSFIKSSDWI